MTKAIKNHPTLNATQNLVFDPRIPSDYFDSIAEVLLSGSILKIAHKDYRICEIEFYYFGPQYKDPYTHRHDQQKKFGGWYFHQKGEGENAFKGGKYKGVDLTMGSQEKYFGILIRSIKNLETSERIEGPSLVVDTILKENGVRSIIELLQSHQEFMTLSEIKSNVSNKIYCSPRIGLNPIKEKSLDEYIHHMLAPFRYLTEPHEIQYGKHTLFLYNTVYINSENLISEIKIRLTEAEKYIAWFQAGKALNVSELPCDKKVETFCKYYGAYQSLLKKSPEVIEVEEEDLLKMAIRDYKAGDLASLIEVCDVGISSRLSSNIIAELYKLRGIAQAHRKNFLHAKSDFLSALTITPNDDLCLANFITASIESEDIPGVLNALKGIYHDLNNDCKNLVLDNLCEAIKNKVIKVEEVPEAIVADLFQYLKRTA